LNISNPATGAQKLVDIEDERKLRAFMDKRISQEVDASSLGDEWKVRLRNKNTKKILIIINAH
jgi:small subunit ribosomal protein S6e